MRPRVKLGSEAQRETWSCSDCDARDLGQVKLPRGLFPLVCEAAEWGCVVVGNFYISTPVTLISSHAISPGLPSSLTSKTTTTAVLKNIVYPTMSACPESPVLCVSNRIRVTVEIESLVWFGFS